MTDPGRRATSGLTHVDADGAARMVDVSGKEVTVRTATARGRVLLSPATARLVAAGGMPKGDTLAVARVAGIMAAKRTPDLVPLCHPIALHGVEVHLGVVEDAVEIEARVRTADRTGVEMEALTAVAVAGLTVIDMVKAVEPAATVTDVRVVAKAGGASGPWTADAGRRAEGPGREPARSGPDPVERHYEPSSRDGRAAPVPVGATAVVVTVSDRSAAGTRADESGPLLAARLAELGFAVGAPVVVPDSVPVVVGALRAAIADGANLVVTTGGTGFAPRDVTPEATAQVLDRLAPGLTEALRRYRSDDLPMTALSRGIAGTAGATVVVNLPGSPGGVRDGVDVLAPVIGHAVAQASGQASHHQAGPGA